MKKREPMTKKDKSDLITALIAAGIVLLLLYNWKIVICLLFLPVVFFLI